MKYITPIPDSGDDKDAGTHISLSSKEVWISTMKMITVITFLQYYSCNAHEIV